MSDQDTGADAPPSGAQGRRVGDFELRRELGRGGMVVVNLVRRLDLQCFVALEEYEVSA
jgi:hypothetical protein